MQEYNNEKNGSEVIGVCPRFFMIFTGIEEFMPVTIINTVINPSLQ